MIQENQKLLKSRFLSYFALLLIFNGTYGLCNSLTGHFCSFCEEGKFLDSTGKCQFCFENCNVCNGPNLENCVLAKEGFFFSFKLKAILSCSEPNCGKCDKIKCTECADGHYAEFIKSRLTKCVKCSENCSYCDETGCIKCHKDFFLKNDVCQKASNKCASERDISLSEYRYFDQSAEKCFKCKSDCEECIGDYKCMHCFPGFRLDHKKFICEKCDDQFCLFCSDKKSKCVDCVNGYYVNKNTHKCEKCAQNCSSCFGPESDHCKHCYFPFRLEKYVDKSTLEKLHQMKEELRKKYSNLSGHELRNLNLSLLGQRNRCVLTCKKELASGKCAEVHMKNFDNLEAMEDL